MIQHEQHSNGTEATRADASPSEQTAELVLVAQALARDDRALVPACTIAVAVEVGSRWQLLAQAGSVDVAVDWRGTLAASTGGGDGSRRGDGFAVAVPPTTRLRALVILVAESDAGVASRAL